MWFANCDCGNHLECTRLHYVTFISSELYPAVLPAGAVELDLAQVVRSDGCPRHFEEVVRSDALPPQSFPLNKHGDKTFFRTKSHILWQGTPSTNQGKRNAHTSSHQLKIKNLYTEGCLRRCVQFAGKQRKPMKPYLHFACKTRLWNLEIVIMSERAKLTTGATFVPGLQYV